MYVLWRLGRAHSSGLMLHHVLSGHIAPRAHAPTHTWASVANGNSSYSRYADGSHQDRWRMSLICCTSHGTPIFRNRTHLLARKTRTTSQHTCGCREEAGEEVNCIVQQRCMLFNVSYCVEQSCCPPRLHGSSVSHRSSPPATAHTQYGEMLQMLPLELTGSMLLVYVGNLTACATTCTSPSLCKVAGHLTQTAS
jgi:hypothetical protein